MRAPTEPMRSRESMETICTIFVGRSLQIGALNRIGDVPFLLDFGFGGETVLSGERTAQTLEFVESVIICAVLTSLTAVPLPFSPAEACRSPAGAQIITGKSDAACSASLGPNELFTWSLGGSDPRY